MEENTKKVFDDFLWYAAMAMAEVKKVYESSDRPQMQQAAFQGLLQLVQKVMEVQSFLDQQKK